MLQVDLSLISEVKQEKKYIQTLLNAPLARDHREREDDRNSLVQLQIPTDYLLFPRNRN